MTRHYATLAVDELSPGVVLCTLDREAVRNAIDQRTIDDLGRLLDERARPETRALILTGAGQRAFASGADIAELRERGRLDALRRINSELFRKVERFPAPTIAAIRGYALGGGLELALACDLRVCGEGARLGQPEVGLGIIPGAGATYRLPRLIGLGRARDLVFTGRIIGAEEALAMGLVERVVPDAEVIAAARDLAEQIAKHSPLAVRLAKRALAGAFEASIDTLMSLESAAQAVLFEDDEKRARMDAFLARRKRRKRD